MKTRAGKRRAGFRKSLVITLIIAMIFTMAPVSVSAYTNYPCETDKADAELYPFPIDMTLLSKYLYGSELNLTGKARYTAYYNSVPREWYSRDIAKGLTQIGQAKINNRYRGSRSAATVYFTPSEYASVNYHSKRLEDLSKTRFSYQGPNNPSNENIAFKIAEGTKFKLIGYNKDWVAVWDYGGIDMSRGLGSTCGGIGTEQYGSWKPGVYFIKRKDCYITDIRNQDLNIPEVNASGTATCDIAVKTTPASDEYVTAGVIKSNELFQISNNAQKINGHYQIYFRQGLYYVNSKWVNLKRATEKKPEIKYEATVKSSDPVEVKVSASASAQAEGSVKENFLVQVIKKNAGNGYSQIWFNSKRCYILTKSLTDFKDYGSFESVKNAGKAKGIIVFDAPWSSYGATAYTAEGIKILKKKRMDEGEAMIKIRKLKYPTYHVSEGDTAVVLGISKFKFVPDTRVPDYKEKATVYKVVYKGKICYIYTTNTLHETFNYYPGTKYKKKVKSNTKTFKIYAAGYTTYSLESYNINGNDYYKIDDIAKMFSKTNKSFSVKYDTAHSAIIVNSMSPYKGSTSLKKGDGVKRNASLVAVSFVWDGQIMGIPCYKINGKYYVNPYYIAKLTDSEYDYSNTGYTLIDTTSPNNVEAYG